jgi:competence protein ComEA
MDASSVSSDPEMPVPAPVRPRLRLTIGAAVVLLLLGVATTVLVATLGPHGAAETVIPGAAGTSETAGAADDPSAPGSSGVPDDPAPGNGSGSLGEQGLPPEDGSGAPASAPIYVHILGEVVTPGLYELRDGDRAIDVVAAAGGLTDLADDAQLNLARFLSDGEQIIVPKEGEIPPPAVAGAPDGSGSAGTSSGGAINLNLATADELEDLPGVGPELASRIVDWRDANGRFETVDDLLNVAGFGDKKLDALRDAATT